MSPKQETSNLADANPRRTRDIIRRAPSTAMRKASTLFSRKNQPSEPQSAEVSHAAPIHPAPQLPELHFAGSSRGWLNNDLSGNRVDSEESYGDLYGQMASFVGLEHAIQPDDSLATSTTGSNNFISPGAPENPIDVDELASVSAHDSSVDENSDFDPFEGHDDCLAEVAESIESDPWYINEDVEEPPEHEEVEAYPPPQLDDAGPSVQRTRSPSVEIIGVRPLRNGNERAATPPIQPRFYDPVHEAHYAAIQGQELAHAGSNSRQNQSTGSRQRRNQPGLSEGALSTRTNAGLALHRTLMAHPPSSALYARPTACDEHSSDRYVPLGAGRNARQARDDPALSYQFAAPRSYSPSVFQEPLDMSAPEILPHPSYASQQHLTGREPEAITPGSNGTPLYTGAGLTGGPGIFQPGSRSPGNSPSQASTRSSSSAGSKRKREQSDEEPADEEIPREQVQRLESPRPKKKKKAKKASYVISGRIWLDEGEAERYTEILREMGFRGSIHREGL